ncbi:Gfo/Idh/MocA family protein [Halanaerobium hydrogeniformans]|uniref:Oxidoreductase domain protein n=1 Tax=Halanaerobium hydrogeniformans TaxID=656519 RepID=E4RPC1_HALHG|nr:Gfo/Idh/MocA family oxidoreductase [Halanaerobium hydrogeniformans]ADQ13806.1 oxidoreductase domain protein [Halanaerobium hydrogeniformans]
MTEKLKVGVIGVGSMGEHHVRNYLSLKHLCEFIGIYDNDQKRVEGIAQSYGVKSYGDLETLFAEVDIINIATPTSTHYDIAMAALERNVHVLIEKPITAEIAEAEEIIKKAEQKGLVVQVGHIERFNPAVLALPEVLKDKKVIALDSKRLGPYDPRISDTDVIQDLMIHDIDVVNSIVSGPISDIEAYGKITHSDGLIDYAVANMVMSNGAVATLTASRITQKKVRELTITTEDSYIELDYLQRKILVTKKRELLGGKKKQPKTELEEIIVEEKEPLKSQLKHFINSIKNGTRPLIDANDALEALSLTKKIQKRIYSKGRK